MLLAFQSREITEIIVKNIRNPLKDAISASLISWLLIQRIIVIVRIHVNKIKIADINEIKLICITDVAVKRSNIYKIGNMVLLTGWFAIIINITIWKVITRRQEMRGTPSTINPMKLLPKDDTFSAGKIINRKHNTIELNATISNLALSLNLHR